jgi:hypothetical protein
MKDEQNTRPASTSENNMDEKDKLPEEQGSRGEEAQPSFEAFESKNYVKPKKSKKPLILTLSCTAAVLAAGLGTAFFLSNYNPGNGEITGTLQTVEHKHDFLKSGFILPTCTEEGEYTFSCYCGETVTEKRPPLGHSEEMRERIEPTCTDAGRKEEYFCTVCGESLGGGEEISALGHKEVIDSGRAPTKTEDGLYTVKISHSDTFTGVIHGLDQVYYTVGDEVKSNVPVGFSKGEQEVQVTMYSQGELLNCFTLTEENCLAWVSEE